MRYFTLVFLFIFVQLSCLAQTAIIYIYDDAGNRVTRIPSTEVTVINRHYQNPQSGTIAIPNEYFLFNNSNLFCKIIRSYYLDPVNRYYTNLYEWNNLSDYSNGRLKSPQITASNFNTKQRRI